MATESTNIWLNDPSVLFKKGQINQLWPKEKMSQNEKINAITKIYYLTHTAHLHLHFLFIVVVIAQGAEQLVHIYNLQLVFRFNRAQ